MVQTKTDDKKPKTNEEPPKPPVSNVNYIFHIDDDAEIVCLVGGVNVNMLIDSGSKNNIINDKTWKYLKSNNGIVTNQQQGSDQIFMAYGSKNPLNVLGTFEASKKIRKILRN